jgi:hypothetical protein
MGQETSQEDNENNENYPAEAEDRELVKSEDDYEEEDEQDNVEDPEEESVEREESSEM